MARESGEPGSTSDATEKAPQMLLGGRLVVAEVSRLDAKLEVGRRGLREGAVLALARTEPAAA